MSLAILLVFYVLLLALSCVHGAFILIYILSLINFLTNLAFFFIPGKIPKWVIYSYGLLVIVVSVAELVYVVVVGSTFMTVSTSILAFFLIVILFLVAVTFQAITFALYARKKIDESDLKH